MKKEKKEKKEKVFTKLELVTILGWPHRKQTKLMELSEPPVKELEISIINGRYKYCYSVDQIRRMLIASGYKEVPGTIDIWAPKFIELLEDIK